MGELSWGFEKRQAFSGRRGTRARDSLSLRHVVCTVNSILLEAGHAVSADFGMARAVTAAGGERLTETGVSVGTPHYMSPAFPAALILLWR